MSKSRSFVVLLSISLCIGTTIAAAQGPPTIPEIINTLYHAYESIQTIEIEVELAVVKDFEKVIKANNRVAKYYFGTDNKNFYLERELHTNRRITENNKNTWDGKSLRTYNFYDSSPSDASITLDPDEAIRLSSYPLPWKVFSENSPDFYWFNSTENTLAPETVTIRGHECYVIITDNPIINGTAQEGKQYRSYLDPIIGYMPCQVDLMDHLNPENVIQRRSYLDYDNLENGLNLARRIEHEQFRRDPELPTRKNLFVITNFSINSPILESKFTLTFPLGTSVSVVTRSPAAKINIITLIHPAVIAVISIILIAFLVDIYYRLKARKG